MYKKTFQDYIPLCDQEIEDKKAILKFISLNDDCLLRSNLIAHITSSAIVVNEKMDKVLCIHHNIYNSWGWVGGHNDGNPNLLEVAIKEAIEETGVTEIAPYSDILCLNGWTYNSLPLILVLCSFRDLYLPLYKCGKAVLSFVIFHPSVLQKLKRGYKYSLAKLETKSAK